MIEVSMIFCTNPRLHHRSVRINNESLITFIHRLDSTLLKKSKMRIKNKDYEKKKKVTIFQADVLQSKIFIVSIVLTV